MLPFRNVGSTFTNTAGRSIQVAVSAYGLSGTNDDLIAYVGGIVVARAMISDPGAKSNTVTFAVPPGATYRIVPYIGPVAFNFWSELY